MMMDRIFTYTKPSKLRAKRLNAGSQERIARRKDSSVRLEKSAEKGATQIHPSSHPLAKTSTSPISFVTSRGAETRKLRTKANVLSISSYRRSFPTFTMALHGDTQVSLPVTARIYQLSEWRVRTVTSFQIFENSMGSPRRAFGSYKQPRPFEAAEYRKFAQVHYIPNFAAYCGSAARYVYFSAVIDSSKVPKPLPQYTRAVIWIGPVSTHRARILKYLIPRERNCETATSHCTKVHITFSPFDFLHARHALHSSAFDKLINFLIN